MGRLNCINLAVIETIFLLLIVFILSNCIWLLLLWPSSSFYLIKGRHTQICFLVSFTFIFFIIKSLILINFKILRERKLSLSMCVTHLTYATGFSQTYGPPCIERSRFHKCVVGGSLNSNSYITGTTSFFFSFENTSHVIRLY